MTSECTTGYLVRTLLHDVRVHYRLLSEDTPP